MIVTLTVGDDVLTDYICDHPGCPNIATHVLGVCWELRAAYVVCEEHAKSEETGTT